jgi:serine/threonine protein phosphatase PrpC
MHSGIKYSFGNHSDVGKKRKINQDSFGTAKNDWGEIFIVADGMGGHKGGEVASKITVDHMCNAFKIASKDTSPVVFLERTINSANDTVLAKAQEGPEYEGMGTTIVAVIIKDNEAHIAHVGDSRLYLFRYNQPFFKTKDHSFVQDLVDQGLISEAEAETHPNKNRILQAIGTGQVKPDITTQTLYKGDHILICSDGLSGEVNETELFNELNSSKPMVASKSLVDLANERGGPDNITVIAIHIDKGEKPPKKPKLAMKDQLVIDPMSPSPNRLLAIGLILGILLSFIGYMTYQHFKRSKINIIVSGGPKTVKSKLSDTTATLVDTVMLNDSSVIELNNPKQSSNQTTEKTNAAAVSKKEGIEQKNIQNQVKNKIGETENDQSNGDED